MESTKKNLWGCGYDLPPPSCNNNNSKKKKKKRSSKKKDSETIRSCSPVADHVNLATSLIKYVKKKCSSFNKMKNNKANKAQEENKKKHHHHQKRKKTGKHATAANVVTLRDWMLGSPVGDMRDGSSGEFIVFMQSASKKIHPASRINPNPDDNHDTDFGSLSINKSHYNMDQMEKLNSVAGGGGYGGGAGEGGGASSSRQPRRRSSENDRGRKRVSFMLPLVTDVYILESADLT